MTDEAKYRAAAEKAYDAAIAAGGSCEEAKKSAEDATWALFISELVRSGTLEIVRVREDGELIYRVTGQDPSQQSCNGSSPSEDELPPDRGGGAVS